MQFKQWLNEIKHFDLEGSFNINGVECDAIDFRFEDWASGLKQQNKIAPPVSKYMWSPFSAPLKNGTYLNYREDPPARAAGNILPAVAARPKVQMISSEPLFDELPHYWFDFAVFFKQGQIVKEPMLKRSNDIFKNLGKPSSLFQTTGTATPEE